MYGVTDVETVKHSEMKFYALGSTNRLERDGEQEVAQRWSN